MLKAFILRLVVVAREGKFIYNMQNAKPAGGQIVKTDNMFLFISLPRRPMSDQFALRGREAKY